MVPAVVFGASTQSKFLQLSTDKYVGTSARVSILTYTFSLSEATGVLVSGDGRFYGAGTRMPVIDIMIDGTSQYSDYALMDWGGTHDMQHSFNTIAYKVLQPGSHTISLSGYTHPVWGTPGAFYVGAGSGLSVMVDPAPGVLVKYLSSDSSKINLTTYNPPSVNIHEGDPRPTVRLLSQTVPPTGSANSNVITLVSGTSFKDGGEGDAAWGIYRNGTCQSKNTASWAVNDLWVGSEYAAPMSNHAYHENVPSSLISFEATELVFNDSKNHFENPVKYRVSATTRMISLWGTSLSGSAPTSTSFCSTYEFKCVGKIANASQEAIDYNCPLKTGDVSIASKTVNIPSGHNGVIFVSAKSRVQGIGPGTFETFGFGIKIDGIKVGTLGIQQLSGPGREESSRGVTASYVSAPNTLSVGNHTIEVYANVSGDFDHVFVPNDLALIYFD